MDKVCRDCGTAKPLEDFSPSKKNRDGRVSYCRPCLRVRNRAYRDARAGSEPTRKHPARLSSPDVKWCPQCRQEVPRTGFGSNRSSRDGLTAYCRPCHNRRMRELRLERHGSTRDFHLKRRYGLTSADVDRMVEEQGGVCAVCRTRPPQHVDHDHLTGLVRGVLCSTCNQGLGNFGDAARLRLAAQYVERLSWQKVREHPGVVRLVPPRDSTSSRAVVPDLGPLVAEARRRARQVDRRERPAAVARRRRP